MSKIYKSADELIGRTPLLEVTNLEKKYNLKARILVKLEYFNPAGSVKDRIAKAMIDDEVDSLLASPQAATFSEEKQRCILDLKYSSWDALPDYGIPIWYSCEHENEGKDSVKIDEAYIRALEAQNELFYEEYMDVFKETVNKAVRCDSLE